MTRRIASRASRPLLAAYVRARTAGWPEGTRLFVVGDRLGWSIDDDSTRLTAAAQRLGYEVAPAPWARYAGRQAVFHPEHFGALRPRWLDSSHRLGLSYFHGRPGTPGYPEFDEAYEALRRNATRVDRIQVTHDEMRELVVSAGVPAARVFQIPIGVDIGRFPFGNHAARAAARVLLGLPRDAFVVGSFQKDGVGLGAGNEPKLVKGPDTLLSTLEQLQGSVPELHVLLTGRARGFVRAGLDRLGIPHVHHELASRNDLARAYHALDVYLVTARQEGGPKAVLEAMATGVPLVTTRVGQAPEIVVQGENGLLVDVDDVEGLAAAVLEVHDDSQLAAGLGNAGRPTAEAFADEQLDERWAALLDGFVGRKDAHED
ncbi:MAG TPA: glycosyltransferase family 4 protein [Gaiellaceae bacterium]